MRIINLIEDTPGAPGCLYEHGLSFYIETERHRLLLDTGASEKFIENAAILGVEFERIDTVILSHGHYDHTGGLLAFAKMNPRARILLRSGADGEFYNLKSSEPKYIGMEQSIFSLDRVEFVDGNSDLDSELSIFGKVESKRLAPRGNLTLKRRLNGEFIQDDFAHEQYLVVTEGDERVLLSGCAHNGILNILDRFRELYGGEPTRVISGFHTVKPDYAPEDDQLIAETARELSRMNTRFYTGHCTGEHAMEIMQSIMGDRLTVLHSGDEIL